MASEPIAKAVLLTDLVGSTTLAESLGEARVAAIWSRHDRARKRCEGLPAWLTHFGSRVLSLAEEIEAG